MTKLYSGVRACARARMGAGERECVRAQVGVSVRVCIQVCKVDAKA